MLYFLVGIVRVYTHFLSLSSISCIVLSIYFTLPAAIASLGSFAHVTPSSRIISLPSRWVLTPEASRSPSYLVTIYSTQISTSIQNHTQTQLSLPLAPGLLRMLIAQSFSSSPSPSRPYNHKLRLQLDSTQIRPRRKAPHLPHHTQTRHATCSTPMPPRPSPMIHAPKAPAVPITPLRFHLIPGAQPSPSVPSPPRYHIRQLAALRLDLACPS
jgi:hypothetical protein